MDAVAHTARGKQKGDCKHGTGRQGSCNATKTRPVLYSVGWKAHKTQLLDRFRLIVIEVQLLGENGGASFVSLYACTCNLLLPCCDLLRS